VVTRWRFPRSATRFAGGEQQDKIAGSKLADSGDVISTEPFRRLVHHQVPRQCRHVLCPHLIDPGPAAEPTKVTDRSLNQVTGMHDPDPIARTSN
jgi:hypothetical protein